VDTATWAAVDDYIGELFVGRDEVLEGALRESAAAGLPAIQVSPAQGKLLFLLARSLAARNILEIGTLGGYSAIWLGRAVAPEGRVITLESEPRHAEVARRNLARVGLERRVEVLVGPALESLPKLAAAARGPFDMTFIDADKESYPEYLDWAARLTRPGGLILADNVVRKGAVADPGSDDRNVQAVRHFNSLLAADARVEATIIQTVGSKGYDGFAIGVVR
jgi:predicted O-methyltransferase YrrM